MSSTEIYASATGSATARIYDAAVPLAQIYGYNWDPVSSVPWFNYDDSGPRQVWFDDSLSLALKYNLAVEKDLAGVGMWALGYDGDRPELWGALADYLGTTVSPTEERRFVLEQNYPNPFAVGTTIDYELFAAGNVRLSVYDLRGALVRTLVAGYRSEGPDTYAFTPVDARGRPPGIGHLLRHAAAGRGAAGGQENGPVEVIQADRPTP